MNQKQKGIIFVVLSLYGTFCVSLDEHHSNSTGSFSISSVSNDVTINASTGTLQFNASVFDNTATGEKTYGTISSSNTTLGSSVTGDILVNGDLTVDQDLSITGKLTVYGSVTIDSGKTLTVTGDIMFDGSRGSNETVTITGDIVGPDYHVMTNPTDPGAKNIIIQNYDATTTVVTVSGTVTASGDIIFRDNTTATASIKPVTITGTIISHGSVRFVKNKNTTSGAIGVHIDTNSTITASQEMLFAQNEGFPSVCLLGTVKAARIVADSNQSSGHAGFEFIGGTMEASYDIVFYNNAYTGAGGITGLNVNAGTITSRSGSIVFTNNSSGGQIGVFFNTNSTLRGHDIRFIENEGTGFPGVRIDNTTLTAFDAITFYRNAGGGTASQSGVYCTSAGNLKAKYMYIVSNSATEQLDFAGTETSLYGGAALNVSNGTVFIDTTGSGAVTGGPQS